jgi:ribose/xylose/arabinose/galactoside ABC-type transport system permease subunit
LPVVASVVLVWAVKCFYDAWKRPLPGPWGVPVVGYLPATLVFVPALSWRMGYRTRRMMGASVVMALAIVILFKGFLSVRIPGGAVYEYLPDGLRSFFILYL